MSDPAQMHAHKLQDHDGGSDDTNKGNATAARLQRRDSAAAASHHLRNKKLGAVVHNDQGRRRKRDARQRALHETRQDQDTVDLRVLLHIYPLFHLIHIHVVRTHHISLSDVFKCITDNASVSCRRVWQGQAAAKQRPGHCVRCNLGRALVDNCSRKMRRSELSLTCSNSRGRI